MRTRLLIVAIGSILATPLTQAVPASADTISSLLAQRQQLQQQVNALGGDKAHATQALVESQAALRNTEAEAAANAARLADLQRQQANLQSKIDATKAEIDTQRRLLGDLTRGQYKQLGNNDSIAVIFSAGSFSQAVNQVMAGRSVSRRISDVAKKLKADEEAEAAMAKDLRAKRAQADQVQAQLEQENGRLLVQVAQNDAAINNLDDRSKSLLAQISAINAKIAALQAPRFSSGSGSGGGGGSCGNHFDYGYCTWYVANRRCIPWFGNAWEWYGQAQSYGYPVGSQARVGAVAVWNQSMGGGYGHVAYVESVQADGFTVSEMNYTAWGQVDTRFVPYSNPGPLSGFIYGK